MIKSHHTFSPPHRGQTGQPESLGQAFVCTHLTQALQGRSTRAVTVRRQHQADPQPHFQRPAGAERLWLLPAPPLPSLSPTWFMCSALPDPLKDPCSSPPLCPPFLLWREVQHVLQCPGVTRGSGGHWLQSLCSGAGAGFTGDLCYQLSSFSWRKWR